MCPDVSILIPVAPYHAEIVERAIESARAQTVACKCFYMYDEDGMGAGYTRNRLIEQVDTPYLVFLDADDWIEPEFVETCLEAIRPGRYVYTDWWQDARIIKAPEKPWCAQQWHVVTTLLRTADAVKVGGFDETLDGMEDTDFYLKIVTNRVCGIHIERPLMHYSQDGQRAHNIRDDGREALLRQELLRRYRNQMGCCGEIQEIDETQPIGQRQANDVLAMALWHGNKPEYGRATGRRYPRMSWPRVTWVDIRDIDARPDHWQQIVEPAVNDPLRYQGLDGFAQVLDMTGIRAPGRAGVPRIDRDAIKPDVNEVMRIAQQRLKK